MDVRVLLLALFALDVKSLVAQESSRWGRADSSVVRLAPTAFPQLPPDIRADLVRRECRIPQTYLSERPHNVVAGHLTQAERQDWVILCSVANVSRVLVYRANSPTQPDSLAHALDRRYLQGYGGEIVYSREIVVLRAEEIREHYADSALAIPIQRDGINDAFAGKTAVLHYWHGGKWHLIETEH